MFLLYGNLQHTGLLGWTQAVVGGSIPDRAGKRLDGKSEK